MSSREQKTYTNEFNEYKTITAMIIQILMLLKTIIKRPIRQMINQEAGILEIQLIILLPKEMNHPGQLYVVDTGKTKLIHIQTGILNQT